MSEATPQAAPFLAWPASIASLEQKTRVARDIAARAVDGEIVGIGSGTAAYLVLQRLAARRREEGLVLRVVASSHEIEITAVGLGLDVLPLGHVTPAWMVDGADEVGPDGRILKGRGGALFKEKLLWASCETRLLAIDESKRVERVGTKFAVPVEVHPACVTSVVARTQALGASRAELRTGSGKDGPVVTETGFLIIEATFDDGVPPGVHEQLKLMPGVLETGLFEGYAVEIVSA